MNVQVDKLLLDLRSRDDVHRARAAKAFQELLYSSSRTQSIPGFPSALFGRIDSKTLNRCIALCSSPDINDKLAGVSAIDAMLGILPPEELSTAVKLAANVLKALPSPDPFVMALAARVYARLAQAGGLLMQGPVNIQIMQIIEWLQGERIEFRRWGAVLLLRELARTVPALVYEHIPDLLDNVWTALRDPRVAIREVAAGALSGCLRIANEKNGIVRSDWYQMVYDQAAKGLKLNAAADTIHGSLLGLQELFANTGMFMSKKYPEACEQILQYKDHREALVRQAVVVLMPTMARYNPQEFTAVYLHKCMIYLLSQLKKERDRAISFDAIGRIATHVTSGMAPYLEAILGGVKEGLQQRGRRNAPPEGPIFECIAMLAKSVGSVLTKHMHELLDLMLAFGLSDALVDALVILADCIPPLLAIIQQRLLDLISNLLAGEPYRHPGAPLLSARMLNGSLSAVPPASLAPDPQMITLALRTLGNFDFTGHILSDFVSTCVVNYLEDDSSQVRLAAAQTACKLFAVDPIVRQTSYYAVKLVGEVLEKLLIVAISDPDPILRQETLKALDPTFDRHLAQPENVRSIFMALNDEEFDIRQLSIQLIGRISIYNPAYIMPPLRKTLIQLLTEVEFSKNDRSKEQAAILLAQLVGTSHHLTKPYVTPMLKVLMPKARDRNPDVAAAIVRALGDLAEVGGEDVTASIPKYMELILEDLHDQSSPLKREAALKSLAQLCSSAGYVIEPYIEHPTLLGTLIGVLQTEQGQLTKRETIKAMGNIGALDPYRYTAIERSNASQTDDFAADTGSALDSTPSNESSYYPATAFRALLTILRDPSLSSHHTAVVEAIMYIFRSLRLKCVQFLPQIIPAFVGVMRSCPPKLEEYYIQNLGHLITSVKQHIRGHLSPILSLISDFWNSGTTLQAIIVDLIETIAAAMDGEFKIYLPQLLPLLLQPFEMDTTLDQRKKNTQLRVLRAFGAFGSNLEEYLHLILPAVVKSFESSDELPIRKAAVTCINALCRSFNFMEHASRVVHPLVRTLATAPLDLRAAIMETICALMTHVGPDFSIFVPLINRTMQRHKIQHPQYDKLVSELLKGNELPTDVVKAPSYGEEADPAADAGVNKLPVNQQNLKSAWETAERSKPDDWREWLRRVSIQMLKSTPSHSLRACANLAEVYYPLARELFNAAFISCWGELFDNYQDELVQTIESALASPTIPTEVMQTLLNLAEFMEHDDKMLPIPVHQLGEYAKRCHTYAKALHYKEIEFFSSSSYEVVEDLIRINNHLQQPDVAMGILKFAQQHFDMQRISEDWYERLERWDDALAAFERRQEEEPDNFELTHGRMRCLHALGEWESLSQLAHEHWEYASLETKRKIAALAAASAWGQQDFDAMEDFVSVLKHDSADRAWFKSILNIHRGQYGKAQAHINRARDLLAGELTAFVGESYTRAYNQIVRVQMLSELEEIIQYKELPAGAPDGRERRLMIQKTWMRRLKGCQRDVEVWQRILKVRALVMSPRDSMDMWIKFANLCRKSGRMGLAEKTLNSLLGDEQDMRVQSSNGPPHVLYAHLKFTWTKGERRETLDYLGHFTRRLARDLGLSTDGSSRPSNLAQTGQLGAFTRLLARCYYKQAEWAMAIQDDLSEAVIADSLSAYRQATVLDPAWHKAWHSFALANSSVVAHYMKARQESEGDALPHEMFAGYLVPAVHAFFQSIARSRANALQDTLRLLALWFNYGYHSDVFAAVQEGFSTVTVDTWLGVIPQLIARIHAPAANVRRLVQQILAEVGRAHPQALVYALTVASKYPSAPRRRAALAILDKMREHSALLVEQALLVSQELMRAAVLWHEMWHEALDEASKFYYGQRNIEAMFAVLEPMHEIMERGPETVREIAFESAFGRDLLEAREAGRRYRQFGEATDLLLAWDLYYGVFRRLYRVLTNTRPPPAELIIELEYAAPKLLAAQNLELAVPGTYQSGKPVIKIVKFSPIFDIVTSKQRPRKLKISGSDGNEYPFLLKGHEDLRQDERVMQLFGLVNTLLAKDPETFKRHLSVQKYPAIPLSPHSGLLGWLSGTDTMHRLIHSYREARKILVGIEQKLMSQMAPNYDNLCLMQQIEVFQYALDNTTGQDLYRILWLKSKTSEAWLDRRANYSRSLAVMSMVGYCLGLGDRHPSNLLISRENGIIIHIDYGDCFEVAMTREKYPEKVPFRLTRMLQNAMDVSRIEGTFRVTCENTMRVLRENKESIIAVLEAFTRDPLINWRLVTGGRQVGGGGKQPAHDPTNVNWSERGGNFASRRPRADESNQMDDETQEVLNQRAIAVVDRVTSKLTGRDFNPNVSNAVDRQVELLIRQATALEHLATAFVGWCAFW